MFKVLVLSAVVLCSSTSCGHGLYEEVRDLSEDIQDLYMSSCDLHMEILDNEKTDQVFRIWVSLMLYLIYSRSAWRARRRRFKAWRERRAEKKKEKRYDK